jgi:hypothetical protein
METFLRRRRRCRPCHSRVPLYISFSSPYPNYTTPGLKIKRKKLNTPRSYYEFVQRPDEEVEIPRRGSGPVDIEKFFEVGPVVFQVQVLEDSSYHERGLAFRVGVDVFPEFQDSVLLLIFDGFFQPIDVIIEVEPPAFYFEGGGNEDFGEAKFLLPSEEIGHGMAWDFERNFGVGLKFVTL